MITLSFCSVGVCPSSVLSGLIQPTLLLEERCGRVVNFGRTLMGSRGPFVGGASSSPVFGWNVCHRSHRTIMSPTRRVCSPAKVVQVKGRNGADAGVSKPLDLRHI